MLYNNKLQQVGDSFYAITAIDNVTCDMKVVSRSGDPQNVGQEKNIACHYG